TSFTLEAVLARTPELRDLYEETFPTRASCVPCEVVRLSDGGARVALVQERGWPEAEDVRSLFDLPAEHPLTPAAPHAAPASLSFVDGTAPAEGHAWTDAPVSGSASGQAFAV